MVKKVFAKNPILDFITEVLYVEMRNNACSTPELPVVDKAYNITQSKIRTNKCR